MIPLFQWIVALTSAKKRTRTCPRCGRALVVPAGRPPETLACPSCGAAPAPRPAPE
ncbi:MAG: hypothetical protein HY728_02045 [Candidatus Rokubacteria bacterium]|nr:hypothetical protein [Candidatus Rokubacteria bacterium]